LLFHVAFTGFARMARQTSTRSGASANFVPIPGNNWLTCYSLRLNPGKISSAVQENHEDAPLPEQGLGFLGKTAPEIIIRLGFYRTRWGKRRRYRCQTCERTFWSNTGTPYYRLQHRRATFDQVATISVEGLNKSAIARVEGIGWNTVDRWLEKSQRLRPSLQRQRNNRVPSLRASGRRNPNHYLRKQQPTWIFAAVEVRSRLWTSTVVGRRSYENTMALFRDVAERTNPADLPLITTDGFEFYERVIWQVFGPACIYGQIIKTLRNNRIVKVERRAVVGTQKRLHERLQQSENSSTLNTSFIERLNLTIRQGSAYLSRRTICHARWRQRLEGHLELLRCCYNFVRPHRALKFGQDMRTPAMQAGLTGKRLTLRQVFCSGIVLLTWCEIAFRGRRLWPSFILC
jgi:transposase-like protein/IS1 family transposase